MLPNVAGERVTKVQILVYSVILVASTLVPSFTGFMGPIYTTAAVVTGAGFLWLAYALFRTRENVAMKKAGRALFAYSLSYLFVVFLALITDHIARQMGWF
jgi:protoheme IX farnesyltransferase